MKNSPTQQPSYEQHIDDSDISSSFLECWNIYSQNKSELVHELKKPGDVVEVPIEVTIPPKNNGSEPEIPASASLVIRLAEEDEDNKNTVAFFRGPGMVVESYQLNQLSLTQRPFHAIVVCGEARTPITDSDHKLDSFLRAAEPPSHNEWTVTKRLKETYRPGYKKLLDELTRKVKEGIRKHVSEKTPTGTEGPQLLKKLFPLQEIGSQQPTKPKPFRVSNQSAELEKDGWKFSGTVNVNPHYSKANKNWRGVIDLRFCAEDGQDSSGGFINKFNIDQKAISKGAAFTIEDGLGIITANSSVGRILFSGSTDPQKYPIQASHASVEIHTKISWAKED